jgi:hypothetical protein
MQARKQMQSLRRLLQRRLRLRRQGVGAAAKGTSALMGAGAVEA